MNTMKRGQRQKLNRRIREREAARVLQACYDNRQNIGYRPMETVIVTVPGSVLAYIQPFPVPICLRQIFGGKAL